MCVYCLCYDKERSTDMSEEQVAEDRYPDPNDRGPTQDY